LEGGPVRIVHTNVYSTYRVRNNKIKSLVGAPTYVGGEFDITNNSELESLEGIPKQVIGDFYCYNNKIEFTQAQIRALCDVKGNVYV
jgi:hypothetical protein